MDAIPEFPNLVVEKKRVYEAEERQQQSPSLPLNRDSSIGDGSSGEVKSSSSSICQYSTWKQKRKLNHNDTNSVVGGQENHSYSTSGQGQLKSPNSKYSPHSNDGSLPSSGMTSPVSISLATTTNSDSSRDAGEKLVDDDRIIPVHDNPFFVKDGKRSIDRRDMNGSLDYHNDDIVNNRQDLSNFRDDTDMEYHPGSGFVSRLKDKFSSLGVREDVTVLRPKRSSSFENLLDGRSKSHPYNGGDLGLTDTRRKFRDGRAVSVENLNHTMDKSSTSPNLALDLKLAKQGSSDSGSGFKNTIKDREIVVTEKSPTILTVAQSPDYDAKPHITVISAASDENKNVDELPKPNTVSSFRSLFENSSANNEIVMTRPKSKAPVAPGRSVNSTQDTSMSSTKKESKVAPIVTKTAPTPKERNTEVSVKKNDQKNDKDRTSVKATAKQTVPNLPLASRVSFSPTLETSSSQINQVSDSKRVAPGSGGNDHHSVSESKENTTPPSDTNAEFNNRGLPSMLMRKTTDDTMELGQVVLRKVKPRILEDDDELKGRITYYPAGLSKTTNSTPSDEPTPKMIHPPLVTDIRGFDATDLWGEDDDDDDDAVYVDGEVIEKDVENNRHIIITDSMFKKTANVDQLTHLDLSRITNDGNQEYQEGYIPSKIGPCKIQFIGADIKLDRSCIEKKKTQKHKVCFSNQISTSHDYPSEEVMLEHYLLEHPDEQKELLLLEGHALTDGSMNESTDDGSESDDSSPVSPEDSMKTNMALSSTGSLAMYHSKYGMEYEFGMQMEEELNPAPPDKKLKTAQETDIYQLTPADDRDLTSWSNSSSSDLLF